MGVHHGSTIRPQEGFSTEDAVWLRILDREPQLRKKTGAEVRRILEEGRFSEQIIKEHLSRRKRRASLALRGKKEAPGVTRIKRGQVWRDTDKRQKNRTVTIIALPRGENWAECRTTKGRNVRIRRDRLDGKQYVLVRESSCA